jgi:hypothetical protein
MHTTTSRSRLGGWRPARVLARAAATAAVLLAVLGCTSGTSLIAPEVKTPLGNHLPVDPTATTGPISIHEVAATALLVGGNTSQVTASCPAGELALSGGWDLSRPAGARVYAAKIVGNSWVVSFFPVGQSGTTNVTAYVECLRGAGATVTAIPQTVTQSITPSVPSDQVDKAGGFIGTCQTGEGLAGFGFDFGTPASATKLELEASVPSEVLNALWWSFKVWNYDTVAHDVTFTLQCLTTTRSGSEVHDTAQQGNPLPPTMSETTTTDCPAGTMVAAGGFAYSLAGPRTGAYIGNEYGQHATATGWQSSMIAFTANTELYLIVPQVAAVCMTLG